MGEDIHMESHNTAMIFIVQADAVLFGACISACEKGRQWLYAIDLLQSAADCTMLGAAKHGAQNGFNMVKINKDKY